MVSQAALLVSAPPALHNCALCLVLQVGWNPFWWAALAAPKVHCGARVMVWTASRSQTPAPNRLVHQVETEHLDSEEREVIDPLRALLSSHDKERLYDDFTAARANAPTHPHPRAPQAPALLAKILHPVAGAVDRVRDAVTGREPVLP